MKSLPVGVRVFGIGIISVLIIAFVFSKDFIPEANKCDCLKIGEIKAVGDSITGLYCPSTLYGVKLLDSFSTWDGNERVFKAYIERLQVKQEEGKWYPIDDCIVEIREVNGCIASAMQGQPNEEDSIIIAKLKNKTK